MSDLDHLMARNERVAVGFSGSEPPIKNHVPVVILSCVDPRTSPVHFLDLAPGDAYIMRTVGGRVTDTVETELAILWFLITRTSGREPELSIAVVHHTDCGMQKISSEDARDALSEQLGTEEFSSVYPAPDPEESVRFDVEKLRNSSIVPKGLRVTGHVYDVGTGRLSRVVD